MVKTDLIQKASSNKELMLFSKRNFKAQNDKFIFQFSNHLIILVFTTKSLLIYSTNVCPRYF